MDHLIALLDRWERKRVVVVGDYMLDRYDYGHVDRLAPDAPVPILEVKQTRYAPGGAANVCLALSALQCEVVCVGLVGDDEAGRTLRDALEKIGCDTTGLLVSNDRPTTTKHNLIGLAQHRHPQKMFRLDMESRDPIDDAMATRLGDAFAAQIKNADATILEDYRKGVMTEALCQRVIGESKQAGKTVLVDPAPVDDYARYRGASCITPNRTEAERAIGRSISQADGDDGLADIHAAAAQLMGDYAITEAVVLTLDKQGAYALDAQGHGEIIGTRARSVYDVTGAGDVVVAMLAAALTNGASYPEATRLANVAAGLEVEQSGVVPIPLDDVLLELLRERHEQAGKVRELEALLPELTAYRRQGKTVAFTNGCFDILHAGHVAFLRESRRQGDLLVVGLNSDDSIRRIKGEIDGKQRPVNEQADRVMVLSELESVDYVVVFDEDTPMRLIEAIKPSVLIKGADYKKHEVVGHEIVEANGGRVHLVDLVAGRSTTNIVRKIGGAGVSRDA